jgi:hypothetical protein
MLVKTSNFFCKVLGCVGIPKLRGLGMRWYYTTSPTFWECPSHVSLICKVNIIMNLNKPKSQGPRRGGFLCLCIGVSTIHSS